MNSVLLLTRLQLAQMIGGARTAIEKRTGANGAMAGTALISVAVFVGIAWLGYSAYGAIGTAGLEATVYDILFLACGGLTFVLSLPQVMGAFFGSSDIYDLLPLPVSPFAIAFSKALSALAPAYLWTALLIAAPLAGWGVAGGFGAHYWVAYTLAIVFAPMTPVAYAGTLAIVFAALFKRVRRKDTISTIATVLTLAVSFIAVLASQNLHLVDNVAAALGGISDVMGGVVMVFPAYGFAVYALAHYDPLGCAFFALVSLATFAVFVIMARVLYLRIVTSLTSGAGKTAAYDGKGNRAQTSVLGALVRAEARKIIRNSSVALYYVAYPLIVTPVMLSFIISSNSMENLGTALAEIGDATSMVAGLGLTTFMILAVVCILSNKTAATCISREGSNWSYMKFIPVSMQTQIRAKVIVGFSVNVVFSMLFMAVGGYFLVSTLGVDVLVAVSGGVLMLGAAWLMTCVGAWSDCRNPHVDWGNDGDVNARILKAGAGVLRAMVVGMVYAVLPLLTSPLIGFESRTFMPIIAIVGIIAAAVLGHALLNAAAHAVESYE